VPARILLPVAERRLPQDHQLGFSQDRSILRTEKVRVQEAVMAVLAALAQLQQQQQQQTGGCTNSIHWTWCWVFLSLGRRHHQQAHLQGEPDASATICSCCPLSTHGVDVFTATGGPCHMQGLVSAAPALFCWMMAVDNIS
jgi:hypothetical protein